MSDPRPLVVRVVTAEEAATADFCVCAGLEMRDTFPDNCLGACDRCAAPIVFRPYMPKNLIKLCVRCANEALAKPGPHRE
jgi:hypothetical protein